MKVLIAVLISLLSYNVYSCSCNAQYPFCYMYTGEENVIIGKIIDTTDHSIVIVIEEVLKGNESRDTITIWDNAVDSSQCEFKHKATHIGHQDDRKIIILKPIDSIVNPWDVIGDYRRPYSLCWEYWLTVANDTVYGFINGDMWAPIPPAVPERIYKMPFNNFRSWVLNNNGCTYLGEQEFDFQSEIEITQTRNQILIHAENDSENSIQLYSINVRLMHVSKFREEAIIDIQDLSKGIYFIQISSESGGTISQKIVR